MTNEAFDPNECPFSYPPGTVLTEKRSPPCPLCGETEETTPAYGAVDSDDSPAARHMQETGETPFDCWRCGLQFWQRWGDYGDRVTVVGGEK